MAYQKKQLTVFNWEEYLNNIKERAKATFVFSSEESYYLYKGKRITEQDLYLMLPIELVRTNIKGDNPDTTHVS